MKRFLQFKETLQKSFLQTDTTCEPESDTFYATNKNQFHYHQCPNALGRALTLSDSPGYMSGDPDSASLYGEKLGNIKLTCKALNRSTKASFFTNHAQCITETGYLADKARTQAPDRRNSILGSCSTGGAILHWPNAVEFHNSAPALLSPFLSFFF